MAAILQKRLPLTCQCKTVKAGRGQTYEQGLSRRLTQGECIPVSSAIRLRDIPSKTSFTAFGVMLSFCSRKSMSARYGRARPQSECL
jgi:hypothetical protein